MRTELLKKDCVLPEHPTTVRNHLRVIESLGKRRHPRSGVFVATELQGPRPVHLIDEWRLLQDCAASSSVSGAPARDEACGPGVAQSPQAEGDDEVPFGLSSIDEFMPEQAPFVQPEISPGIEQPPSPSLDPESAEVSKGTEAIHPLL